MILTQITVHLDSPPNDFWETALPALLGILGVLVGAWLTNMGQKSRDRAATAQQIRSMALTAVTAVMSHLGSVSTLIIFATSDKLEGHIEKVHEASSAATATSADAQNATSVLAGVADSEVAKQGAQLHRQLVNMSDELMPLLRQSRFAEAKSRFAAHRTEIHRSYNILIFMVQARDQLQSGGPWSGEPFFRSRRQATLQHDYLGD